MKVLVVEDSKPLRLQVVRTLRKLGVSDTDLMVAENGSDALVRLRDAEPDVILSDWAMPEMGGVDLLRELRSRRCSVRFCLMAPGTPSAHMLEKAREEGAHSLLSHPLSTEALRRALELRVGD